MVIRNAKISDLRTVYQLEQSIREVSASRLDTLISRFKMFSEGFRVAEHSGEVCGYVSSCLWNIDSFEKFSEIKNFPKYHTPEGKNLYVIFLGVNEKHRRKGFGSSLITSLTEYAIEKDLDKVHLVAGEEFLPDFYKRLGFETVRELPDFLPYMSGTLMEYNIIK